MMDSNEFRKIEIGDEFRLDGQLYRKRTDYSALRLREPGEQPKNNINRMIRPGTAVAVEKQPAESV